MWLCSLNGVVKLVAETSISVLDDGFLRGDGAFEVTRIYNGRPFALAEHLTRLGRSAAALRLSFDHAALEHEITQLLTQADVKEAALRVVVTRGGSRLVTLADVPQQPLAIKLISVQYSPTGLLDGVKSLSYAANMLATRIAHERGGDEALLVTPLGDVLEAPTATIFWAENGTLKTPPLSEPILDSITRRRILKGVTVVEQSCSLSHLLEQAEEVFIASSVREVMPVSVVDGRELQSVAGPQTKAAAKALREQIVSATSS